MSSIHTLFVKLKFNDFQQTTVECVHDSLDLNILCQLIHEGFLRKRMPVRLLGIGIKLKQERIHEGIQLELNLDQNELDSICHYKDQSSLRSQ